MSLVTFTSARGAPGVTTTALLVAGAIEDSVLVEADPAGGVLAIRYDLGREPGLTTLAAQRPGDPDAWRNHAQDAGGVAVLVGPDSPDNSESLWRGAANRLGTVLHESSAEVVIVDAGRMRSVIPLADQSALIVVVVRPIAEQLIALSHRLPALRRSAPASRIAVLSVGVGSYRSNEIEAQLQVGVLGELPFEPKAAAALLDGSRNPTAFGRTRLARSAAGVGLAIAESLHDIGAMDGALR